MHSLVFDDFVYGYNLFPKRLLTFLNSVIASNTVCYEYQPPRSPFVSYRRVFFAAKLYPQARRRMAAFSPCFHTNKSLSTKPLSLFFPGHTLFIEKPTKCKIMPRFQLHLHLPNPILGRTDNGWCVVTFTFNFI